MQVTHTIISIFKHLNRLHFWKGGGCSGLVKNSKYLLRNVHRKLGVLFTCFVTFTSTLLYSAIWNQLSIYLNKTGLITPKYRINVKKLQKYDSTNFKYGYQNWSTNSYIILGHISKLTSFGGRLCTILSNYIQTIYKWIWSYIVTGGNIFHICVPMFLQLNNFE